MKNKILKIAFCFVLFSALLITASFAATVKEEVKDYHTTGAYIIGSTRFDTETTITASVAAKAGVNEAKLNLALGKSIDNLDLTFYYYNKNAKAWYEVGEEVKQLATAEAQKVENNLNIFFVNNEEKTLEVKYDGDVDKNSLPSNVEYKDGKFLVPATTFNFTFTETKEVNGEKVVVTSEVSTNVDKNVTTGSTEKAEIKRNPEVKFQLAEEIVLNEPTEFTVSTVANDYAGVMVVGTGSVNPDNVSKLEYAVGDLWVEMTGESIFGNEGAGFPLQDATSKFRVTFDKVGEYNVTFAIKNLETGEIMANVAAKTNVTTTKNVSNQEDLEKALSNEFVTDIKLLKDIDLSKVAIVSTEVKLDLNGHTIKNEKDIWNDTKEINDWSLISVREGGNLTIEGNGTLKAKENDCHAIDVQEGGEVIIKGGTYIGNISAVYVYEGTATINGGTYSIQQLSKYNDYRFTLNCWDANYTAGTAKIIVNGGTFTGFNPADNAAEGKGTNFVAEGYKSVKEGDTYKVLPYDANNVTDEEELRTLISEGKSVTLASDIEITKPIVVNKELTLNLNGKTIKNETDIWQDTETVNDWSLISVREGGNLTIEGNGTLKAKENDCHAIDVQEGGEVIIKGGTYIGNISAVYVYEGTATINGGTYSIQQLSKYNDYRFTLNCWDANYRSGDAKIIVNDGTFMNFNPANNLAEGANTNFVVEGNKIVKDGNKYDVDSISDEDKVLANGIAYTTLADAFAQTESEATVKLIKDIELSAVAVVNNKTITLDLNGHTIKNEKDIWNDTKEINDWSLISVREGGNLTIEGNGTLKAKENDCHAIDVQEGGEVIIKGGTYIGNISAVYVYEGTATINGGTYSIQQLSKYNDYRFTLNCWDANYRSGDAKIIVNDGTFMNFNPANNLAEGANTNFVAEGYKVVADGDNYTVVAE